MQNTPETRSPVVSYPHTYRDNAIHIKGFCLGLVPRDCIATAICQTDPNDATICAGDQDVDDSGQGQSLDHTWTVLKVVSDRYAKVLLMASHQARITQDAYAGLLVRAEMQQPR